MKSNVQDQIQGAKVKYAPQIETMKIKYEEARLKVKGYKTEYVEDSTPTGFLTDFEYHLPLS